MSSYLRNCLKRGSLRGRPLKTPFVPQIMATQQAFQAVSEKWYAMPIVRKISAETFHADEPLVAMPAANGVRLLDVLRISGAERPLTQPPRIGDIVRLKAPPGTPHERILGVVLRVQIRRDGIWTRAELLMDAGVSWVSKSAIEGVVGRPKGVSRIDQPTKRIHDRVHGGTHGWFVRVYEGKRHKIARMFSDSQHGGRADALRVALAFHAAAFEQLKPAEDGG
jgi:hypothetical protein